MTDRFEVPEVAIHYLRANDGELVPAILAVDVPRIVQQELMKYQMFLQSHAPFISRGMEVPGIFRDWVAARFSEPPLSEPCPHGRQECAECCHLEVSEPPEGKMPRLAPEHEAALGRRLVELGVTDVEAWTEGVFRPAPSAETATPEPQACLQEGPRGHDGCAYNCAPLCTKPDGHAGPHQRNDGTPWPNTSCAACPCARCQDLRTFVEATMKLEARRMMHFSIVDAAAWSGLTYEAIAAARRVTEGK